MIVLDANVVIGHLEPSNTLHSRAKSLIVRAIKDQQQLAAHPFTLGEVLVGAAKKGVENAVFLAVTEGLEVEVLQDMSSRWPLDIARVRAQTGLRMPDAVVFEAAKRLDAMVATFDKQLAAVANSANLLYTEL